MRTSWSSADTEKRPDPVHPFGPACIGMAWRADHEGGSFDRCFVDDARTLVTAAVRDFAPEAKKIEGHPWRLRRG